MYYNSLTLTPSFPFSYFPRYAVHGGTGVVLVVMSAIWAQKIFMLPKTQYVIG